MEIKRKLTAAAKRITPAIEASNPGIELGRLADRIVEILDYSEEKAERASRRGVSMGVQVAENRRREAQEIEDVQTEAEREALADQEQGRAQPDVAEENADHVATSDRVEPPDTPAPTPEPRKTKKKGRRSKAKKKT